MGERPRFGTLCLALAGLGLSVWAPRPGATAPVLSGRQIAEQKCARCHAIGETDSSPNPRAPALRDLDRRYPVDGLRDAFAEGLEVGHRNMPQFTLPPAEIDNIVGYLRSLNPCLRPSSDKAAMTRCFAPIEQPSR